MSRLKSKIADFLRDSEGTATIEFILWFPVFVAILSVSADTALFFAYKSAVLRIVDDANRAASLGRLTTAAATKSYIQGKLGTLNANATVTVTMSNGLVLTTVSIPTKYVTATGALSGLSVTNLYVMGQHLLET